MAGPGSSVRKLVSQIEAEIADGAVPVGEVLGTEQELCARYSVSPTIFRQAARILESYKLAAMRPGNRGGLVVQGYALDGAAKTLAIYLEFTGVRMEDVLPVSGLVMSLSPRLAAQRMSLDAADQIRAGLRNISALPTAFERGSAFIELFQQIVETTHNPLLAFTYRVATQFLYDVTAFDSASRAQFERSAKVADQLIEAMVSNDLAGIDLMARTWLQLHRDPSPSLVRETVESEFAFADARSPRTLSEQLARRILREIRERNWPVGTRIGSEYDLLERYGVSRATFRQAIRLLEQYFAVKSRRGPHGGLYVTSADPERVDGLGVAALIEKQMVRAHLDDFAPPLLALAFDMGLGQARAALAKLLDDARDAATSDLPAALRGLHQGIGEASGNLFVQALIRLMTRLAPDIEPAVAAGGASDARHLIDEAARSLKAGDDRRAKRALIELTRGFGFAKSPALSAPASVS